MLALFCSWISLVLAILLLLACIRAPALIEAAFTGTLAALEVAVGLIQ